MMTLMILLINVTNDNINEASNDVSNYATINDVTNESTNDTNNDVAKYATH